MPTFPTLPTVTPPPSQQQQLNYLKPQNQQQTYTQTQVFPAYSQAQVVVPSPVLPTNSAASKNQYVYKTQQTISKVIHPTLVFFKDLILIVILQLAYPALIFIII